MTSRTRMFEGLIACENVIAAPAVGAEARWLDGRRLRLDSSQLNEFALKMIVCEFVELISRNVAPIPSPTRRIPGKDSWSGVSSLKMPLGTSTVPPPVLPAAAIAALIFGESLTTFWPVAPNQRTLIGPLYSRIPLPVPPVGTMIVPSLSPVAELASQKNVPPPPSPTVL